MTSKDDNFSYRNGCRAGKQGPRPSAGNQAGVEYATGTNSAQQAEEEYHAGERGPQNVPAANRQR